jgi:hypothetical protein
MRQSNVIADYDTGSEPFWNDLLISGFLDDLVQPQPTLGMQECPPIPRAFLTLGTFMGSLNIKSLHMVAFARHQHRLAMTRRINVIANVALSPESHTRQLLTEGFGVTDFVIHFYRPEISFFGSDTRSTRLVL